MSLRGLISSDDLTSRGSSLNKSTTNNREEYVRDLEQARAEGNEDRIAMLEGFLSNSDQKIDGTPLDSSKYGDQSHLIRGLLTCTTKADCNRYGKDDIIDALRQRKGLKEGKRRTDDWDSSMLKPQLVNILLNHNKREQQRIARLEKQSRSGTRYTHGAFPSEATNPSMYGANGLIKKEFLTQDHHGLSAYDFKGDKYIVEYRPRINGFGGFAEWKKETSAVPGGNFTYLSGYFVLDKNGLPKVAQLNYAIHFGALHKDKNDKVHVLVCTNRKNAKNLSIHPSNCKPNKNGKFSMKWVPFNKEYTKQPVSVGTQDRKFFLPDGSIVSGKELQKMNLEDIWKMMMLLELMESGNQYSSKLQSLGLGPFANKNTGQPGSKTKRRSSKMDATQRAREEGKFMQAGLDDCGTITVNSAGEEIVHPPHRCYSDSYIPGACVPHEEICFEGQYMDKWDGAGRFGENEKMNWARDNRSELNRAGALESEEGYAAWKAKKQMEDQRANVVGYRSPSYTGAKNLTEVTRSSDGKFRDSDGKYQKSKGVWVK